MNVRTESDLDFMYDKCRSSDRGEARDAEGSAVVLCPSPFMPRAVRRRGCPIA